MLATYALFPIIESFGSRCGIDLQLKDISLAGRVIGQFPDYLKENQRTPDYLAELGVLAKTPEANIIKLPNISASVPQLQACIKELQAQGFAVPDYVEEAGSKD